MPKPTKALEELVSSRAGRRFLRGNPMHGTVATREHADTLARDHVSTAPELRKDVTVKMRLSNVEALQRAMHERTLQNSQGKLSQGEPYTRQDIVDAAVESWLRAHGYLQENG
jgi:hypothetical protein